MTPIIRLCRTAALILLFSSPVQAQFFQQHSPEVRLLHMFFSSTEGEQGVTTYTCDADGRPHKALWHLLDGSRSSLNLHSFDDDGHMALKNRWFSDGMTSEQTYAYDSAGRLLHETFRSSDGRTGSATYSYTARGRLATVECHEYNGWLTGTIRFSSVADGRIQSATVYREGNEIGKGRFQYDEKGNVITETWSFGETFGYELAYVYDPLPVNGQTEYTGSNPFLYHHRGNRLVGETYLYEDDMRSVSGHNDTMVFAEDGCLHSRDYIRSDGLTTKTDYFYDSRGQLTKSYRRYSDGKCAVFSYVFAADGRLLSRAFTRTDGEAGLETYNWDGTVLVGAEWTNVDTWLTGTLTLTDGAHGPKSGHFAGEQFSADLSFTYDREQCLQQIEWRFSFGGLQRYTFVFEETE